ncbi:MAG: alpha/beta hydrolase [Bacteroidales bacterium]|nr:alpha/beta hydrolase [Bacteroidales bacterium]
MDIKASVHRLINTIGIILFLCVYHLGNAQDGYATICDLCYTAKSDTYAQSRCKLDIYYPNQVDSLCPVVVWFHGGGLTSGEKSFPHRLKNQKITLVAVNYRLLPTVNIDDCLDDCAEAVAWVFNHITQYNGSPQEIILSGHSAGGYISAMLGLDKRWLTKYDIECDSIAAMVPVTGQMISHFSYRAMNNISNLQPTIDEYAPLFHVRKDAPPLILISGDRDLELFGRYEENAYMRRMMQLVGHKDTVLYEIGGHGHGPVGDPGQYILLSYIKNRFHV